MKRWAVALSASALGIGVAAAGIFFLLPHRLDPVAHGAGELKGQALIDQGRYLTLAGDCAACHTAPGGKPFAGGLSFELPFGKIYSANITPDRQAGIGDWSDAEFVRAMRHGVGKNGEDLYPAFPYTSYAKLRDEDMLAIFAYLKTLAPISDRPPSNELSFPFDQRWTLRGWKLLFLDNTPYRHDSTKSAAWNRGAYLVEGLAHCGECHTPRNLLFARETYKELSGGVVDGWRAWNITPDVETGIGAWDENALASYLSTGSAKGHGSATGSMRQAIDLSLSKLDGRDIEAMVTYLRSIPEIRSDDPSATALAAPVMGSGAWSSANAKETLGKSLFEGACASCHGWNGQGQATLRQALIGDRNVSDPSGANLVRLLLQGSGSTNYDPSRTMPSFGRAYTDGEIAAISNYVIQHFGGKAGKVTPEAVSSARGAASIP